MEDNNQLLINIDFQKLIKLYWRNAWAIILVAVIFGIIAFGYTVLFVTPVYKSDVLIYVNNNRLSLGGSSVYLTTGDLAVSRYTIDTYMVILKSRSALSEIIKTCDLPYSVETLSGMISGESVDDTEVFRITVQSADQAEAQKIADAVALLLRDRIPEVVEGTTVRIVDYADASYQRVSPSITGNVITAAFTGGVLVCIILLVSMLMDTKIQSEKDLADYYKLPVLAVIPNLEIKEKPGKYGYYKSGKYGYANLK